MGANNSRKLFPRRRAVSTMIAGIIILSIFLTATVAMMLVGKQNDSYRSTMASMQQNDIDRFSENLVGTFPGIVACQPPSSWPTYCKTSPPPGINQYAMNISNYAGIDAHIVRIYINSSASPGCYPPSRPLCILDPSPTPESYAFLTSSSLVNPGEFGHQVVFWLPSTITLPSAPPPVSTISIVTSRGRVFSFRYPFPPQIVGRGGTSVAGNGLNLGPLSIRYETDMITYAINNGSNPNTYPLPINNNPGGGWIFPQSTPVMFFIKIYNQGVNPVTLVSESNFQVVQFGNPGAVQPFFLVAPMDTGLCTGTFQKLDPYNELPACGSDPLFQASISGGNTAVSKTGTVQGYSISQPYVIPPLGPNGGCCGQPVYVLFSAVNAQSSKARSISVSSSNPPAFYTYLNLVFQYDDGGGTYTYGVDLPFIVFCAGTGSYTNTANCPITEV